MNYFLLILFFIITNSCSQIPHEIKTFQNGDKVVKRPKSEIDQIPTLEVQPKNGAGNKVKVRYK